jgi:beta-phosphoglucomutase
MLKAVIFDFDGVISDSEPLHYKAFVKAAKKFDFELTEDLYYRDYVGYCDRECFENLMKNFPGQLKGANVNELIRIKTEAFEEIVKTEAKIIPGVSDLLKILKKNNIRIAICSGATRRDIEMMLAGSGLNHYFELIVSDDDVTKGKPDPQGYNLALQRLNKAKNTSIKPSQCIVIEDSHWGLDAAIAAGMHTIAVTNTYHPEKLAMAELIVNNLGDITFEQLLGLMK